MGDVVQPGSSAHKRERGHRITFPWATCHNRKLQINVECFSSVQQTKIFQFRFPRRAAHPANEDQARRDVIMDELSWVCQGWTQRQLLALRRQGDVDLVTLGGGCLMRGYLCPFTNMRGGIYKNPENPSPISRTCKISPLLCILK